jgi:hypothetical protein
MQSSNLKKAGILGLLILVIAMMSWEMYLRKTYYAAYMGISVSYDDNEALWANNRNMVYEPSDQSVIIIGSSRIKYDLDIPTWQKLTYTHAVQLANRGSDPRPVLNNLANDKNFKGRLLVDVTEGLFFYDDPLLDKRVEYYKNITPTQRFSFQVNHFLESQFVFLDQRAFSISAMLDQLHLPERPGYVAYPPFPTDATRCNFDRQNYFSPRMLKDSNIQNGIKAVWSFNAAHNKVPPVKGFKLDSIILAVKEDVDKIKARGGQVIFLRTPSSGVYRAREVKGYPRSQYWDRLLTMTGCTGIYFEDYPALAHFTCPEWSHLAPPDAITYTENLVKILREEKGWSFNR